jgi:pyruvate dehydrogenase E2 component (dihydrolipoamide acetyltransferase)
VKTDASLKGYRKLTPATVNATQKKTTAKLEVEAPAAAPKVLFQQEKFYRGNKTQMRKIIAKRLAESLFTAPHYNLTIEVVMDDAMQARTTINNLPDKKYHLIDIYQSMCYGFENTPKLTQWKEEAITINHHVNIGVAVAVEDGLVVPVKITDANEFIKLAECKRLGWKSKTKKLLPTEMEGTFTVSNLECLES